MNVYLFYFIGIIESMWGVGAIIGFQISAATVGLWVDFYRVDTETIDVTPRDPRYVGAWWLGLLIAMSLYLFFSIPFWGFPKKLPQKNMGPQYNGVTDQKKEVKQMEPSRGSKNHLISVKGRYKLIKYMEYDLLGKITITYVHLWPYRIITGMWEDISPKRGKQGKTTWNWGKRQNMGWMKFYAHGYFEKKENQLKEELSHPCYKFIINSLFWTPYRLYKPIRRETHTTTENKTNSNNKTKPSLYCRL